MSNRIVYSTENGRVTTCTTCGQAFKSCQCNQTTAGPSRKNDGIVRIMRDRKQRGGKTVTVITGIPGDDTALSTLTQQLKKFCGAGGTNKDGTIEIQGDHCDKIQSKLTTLGYKVKRSGG